MTARADQTEAHMILRLARAAAVAAAAIGAAAAAAPVDRLFSTAHLAAVAPGTTLTYAHVRESDPALGAGPDLAERITLTRGADAVEVTLAAGSASPRRLPPFEGVEGNPVLTVFLEMTLRSIAKATGGSPFYLQRRIRDGLRDRLEETVGPDGAPHLVLRPFAGDPERPRLGAFADLELAFALDDAAPGVITRLAAAAPGPDGRPAYREEIRLDAPP
jgi:hypothetical protein